MLDRRRLLLLAPFGVAAACGVAFWAMLDGMQDGKFDPRGMPSALVGKKLPRFDLPGLAPHAGFASSDLTAPPSPVLVNFFASWCLPCVEEAPELMTLKQRGVPIWGIAYKDKPDATSGFLAQNGDAYQRLATDRTGRVAIDFGVYGVPETYLVDKHGVVRWRWAGGITGDVVAQELNPLLRAYA